MTPGTCASDVESHVASTNLDRGIAGGCEHQNLCAAKNATNLVAPTAQHLRAIATPQREVGMQQTVGDTAMDHGPFCHCDACLANEMPPVDSLMSTTTTAQKRLADEALSGVDDVNAKRFLLQDQKLLEEEQGPHKQLIAQRGFGLCLGVTRSSIDLSDSDTDK